MNTTRTTLAALCLSATAFAQASEITEFPIPTSSTLSRAEVKANAARHYATSSLNYNLAWPTEVKAPPTMLTREQVRKELTASRMDVQRTNSRMASDLVGGM